MALYSLTPEVVNDLKITRADPFNQTYYFNRQVIPDINNHEMITKLREFNVTNKDIQDAIEKIQICFSHFSSQSWTYSVINSYSVIDYVYLNANVNGDDVLINFKLSKFSMTVPQLYINQIISDRTVRIGPFKVDHKRKWGDVPRPITAGEQNLIFNKLLTHAQSVII